MRLSHGGACGLFCGFVCSFVANVISKCLVLILHDDMYTEIEIIQNLSPKIDANVNVL